MGFKVLEVLFLVFIGLGSVVYGDPKVPCYFIFGDSLMDNGNNNDLVTEAKVNFPPYGIDFLDGPTGRFSNGRNIVDIIAKLLGFNGYIPPFATARGKQILRGVNYGSGASGIRDETGKHVGARISLNHQLLNHQVTISRLSSLLGSKRLAKQYLSKCIYTVGMGNNDFINNYFLPEIYITNQLYTPQQYAQLLVQQYSGQLRNLYKNGAKKFGIFGAGYSGCTPAMMANFGTNAASCSTGDVNNAVILFNAQLRDLISNLNNELSDAKFIFIESPLSYTGLSVTNTPCCQVSTTLGKGQCEANQVPCSNRSDYVFWDGFHPTESANLQTGASAYSAMSPLYAASVDILVPKNSGDDQYISSV